MADAPQYPKAKHHLTLIAIGILLVVIFGVILHTVWVALKAFIVAFLFAAIVVGVVEWRFKKWWKATFEKE